MTGLYLHVPFCEGKCPYCDFYSIAADSALCHEYTNALKSELTARASGQTADSLYFGGGTPTLLSCSQLSDLIAAAKVHYSLPKHAEITTEANPKTLTPSKLEGLRKAGINRLSIGVQSGVDDELKALGRKHTAKQAEAAIENAKQAGFENLSVDLMLGVPGQTPASLEQTLEYVKSLNVSHCSCYILKLEPRTPFGRFPPKLPSEEETCEMYLQAVEGLQRMGLKQYEISNFAKDGKQCKHNLKYWLGQSYLGFGAAAHSFEGSLRFAHSRDISRYLREKEHDVINCQKGGDPEEWLMLRLRLTRGVFLSECEAKGFSPTAIVQRLQRLKQEGLADQAGDRFWLTPKGFLVQNAIVLYLLPTLSQSKKKP